MTTHDTRGANSCAESISGVVREFYERYPYPAVVEALDLKHKQSSDARLNLAEHHLFWPARPLRTERSVLIAGCGSNQAARHAMNWPQARVIGIDVSEASLEKTRLLKEKHNLNNLELRRLPLEKVAELNEHFDQIICTGVLHHLPDPDFGLRALKNVLNKGGAMQIMLYAPYGRAGIYLIQEYCRRLGVGTSMEDVSELTKVLHTLPKHHPIWPLLQESPDFRYAGGVADALLHPQDRPYSVPQLLAFLENNGLRFGRWLRQAPYLPGCGAPANTPHHERLSNLALEEQYAAMELFRGNMLRHSLIAYNDDEPASTWAIRFDEDQWLDYRPIRVSDTVCVEKSLPPDMAGVLINQRHTDTDIYMPINITEMGWYQSIDGNRTIRELIPDQATAASAKRFFSRLWQHDQIVLDTTACSGC